ncbi:hypothetical protein [Thalassobacillus sp. B23F22_16]|uniref:hypothetical protein n=1 Tax=Thalassobacillus sp. B23F22_16 TaxID=3459513 RepID=UPI00373E288E
MRSWRNWDEWLNPLYFPLVTAIPVETWLLISIQTKTWNAVELTTFIISALFLVFAGIVELSAEEIKHRFFGHLYLGSAVVFGGLGYLFF